MRGAQDVWISRSTLRGGDGENVGFFAQPYPGGSGVAIESSTVAVVDCQLYGGHGPDGPEDDWYYGAPGMHGADLWDSRVWVSNCGGVGGNGGFGYDDFDIFVGKQCGNGGDGGSGVYVRSWPFYGGSGLAPSTVTVRDIANFAPGVGGGATCGAPGVDGAVLNLVGSEPHQVSELTGIGRSTYASSPVRGGTNARLYAAGEPGDLFLALIGGEAAPLDLAGQPLPLGLALTPLKVLVLGTLPASGELMKAVPTPVPAPGLGGSTLHLQGVVLPVGGPELELAPLGTLTLLEPDA